MGNCTIGIKWSTHRYCTFYERHFRWNHSRLTGETNEFRRSLSVWNVSFSFCSCFLSVFRFFATVLSVFCSIRNNAGPKSQFNQETVAAARIFYNNVTYTQKRATWWISASRQKHAPKESIKKYGKKTKVEVCGLCSNRCIQRYTQHIDWNNCIFWR